MLMKMISKGGLISLVIIILLGVGAVKAYDEYKEDRALTKAIKEAGTPRPWGIDQQINWKNTINNIDDINWTDGKTYKYNKKASADEQELPDMFKLVYADDGKTQLSCAEKYDTCGAAMIVKDAETGEIVGEFKTEEFSNKGTVMFSILGTLVEAEGMTTSETNWDTVRANDKTVPKVYEHLTYEIQIYTIKDGKIKVQGTTSGETKYKWFGKIPNISWSNKVYDEYDSLYHSSYVSVRN